MTSQISHVMTMWFSAFSVQVWSSLFSLKTETHSHQLIAVRFSISLNSGATVLSHKNNQLSHLLHGLRFKRKHLLDLDPIRTKRTPRSTNILY